MATELLQQIQEVFKFSPNRASSKAVEDAENFINKALLLL